MKQSETKVQFTLTSKKEDELIERKRAFGKEFTYEQFKYRWDIYPKILKVTPFPLNVDIEVSSMCNLKCDHCFRQYMNIGKQGLMDFEMFKKIVDECGRFKLFTLKFSMRGEPLLHPKIVEMVSYAKKKGVKETWINTNGSKLTEKIIKGLCKAKLDWITFSFDGLGKMYESIRKPLKFNDSLRRLKLLKKLRDKYRPEMIINVQTVWSAIKDNPEEYVRTMKPLVDRVAYNSDMNFKEIILVPDPDFVCPRLWQRIAICSNGDYLKCPSDFKKLEVLGNFKDISIKDAWDVLQEQQRQLHLKGYINLSKTCSECHHACKKIKRKIMVKNEEMVGYNYRFTKKFSGVGLNRRRKS